MSVKMISERLKQIRLQRNLTQNELGSIAKINPTAIAHFESGRRVPCVENLRKLCTSLQVSADYLLGLSNNG